MRPTLHVLRRDRRQALWGATALLLGAVIARPARAACPALLDHRPLRLQDEKPQALCAHAGRVLLVVNTASQCGFTPQYKALETLHERYAARGLVVLGFPSNDFGKQEPGSNQEIAAFCEDQFSVRFPMFAKGPVSGAGAQPFWKGLNQAAKDQPRWNFHKYLVARDGRQVRSFPSEIDPLSPSFIRELERLLAQT
jgi:glutathione peroxidase